MTQAFIYDAVRSPRGKGRNDGALHEITALDLSAQVLASINDRNELEGHEVEDIAFGCVSPVGEQGAVISRMAALKAGYADTTSAIQVNRFCGSGLEAVNIAAGKICSGEADLAIGGGIESM
ncbi:MAG: acetyl-CoA C-acyltransferase, partial [Parasphingorhabdus sp.]